MCSVRFDLRSKVCFCMHFKEFAELPQRESFDVEFEENGFAS